MIHEQRMGVRFLEESEPLRALIAMSAAEVLRALEANARGDRAANVVGDETLTSAWRTQVTGYVRWIFENDGWHAASVERSGPAGERLHDLRRTSRTSRWRCCGGRTRRATPRRAD